MIQRPQSLLLLAVTTVMSVTAFSNIWVLEQGDLSIVLTTTEITASTSQEPVSTVYLAIVTLGSSILALFSLFQFKKRKLQMILGAFNNLLITSFLLLVSFVALPKALELSGGQDEGSFSLAYFLPIVALIANFISNKLIKKDEELIQSMDRMR